MTVTYLARYIKKGWGSSGYYSTRTLKLAEREQAFPTGTHLHWNHPTRSEMKDRPERSLDTLVAKSIEPAKYLNHPKHGEGLYARVTVFPSHVTQVQEKGNELSILANGRKRFGEAPDNSGNGLKKGYMIERIDPSTKNNVDFVTHAGAGGKLIFESAIELPKDKYLLVESANLYEEHNTMPTETDSNAMQTKLTETLATNSMLTGEVATLKETVATLQQENNALKITVALSEALQDEFFTPLKTHEINAIKALTKVPIKEGVVDDKALLEALKESAKPFLPDDTDNTTKPATKVAGMGNGSFGKGNQGNDEGYARLAEAANTRLYGKA